LKNYHKYPSKIPNPFPYYFVNLPSPSQIICTGCQKEYTLKEARNSVFQLFTSAERQACNKCGTKLEVGLEAYDLVEE
jgi:hypothetical protein